MRPFGRLLFRRLLGRLLLVAAVFLVGWGSRSGWATEWDVPSGFPVGNLHVETLQGFAADVERRTGGALSLNVRPASGLSGEPDTWDAVRSGRVPAGEVTAAALATVHPIFAINCLPFLATDHATAWRLYQVVRPYFQQHLAEHGIELLYAVAWPPQGLFADRPIDSARALGSLKFRTGSPFGLRLAEMLEAQPRPTANRDLEAALSKGQIQAMIGSADTAIDSLAWRHLGHFYDLRAWLPLNLVIVRRAAVEALSPEERAALRAAAAQAEVDGWQHSAAHIEAQLAYLTAKGMMVHSPSSQLKEDLRVLGAVLTQDWLRLVGGEGITVISDFAR